MKKSFYAVLCLSILMFYSCNNKYKGLEEGIYADIVTEKGSVVCKLYEQEAPMTVASFITLAEGTNKKATDSLQGKKYFDGLTFHRVVPDFVIQGGDPLANGMGGPGYIFQDEFAKDSANVLIHKHNAAGVLSMANPGPDSNGSQFFITLKPTPWLDNKHTVFGKVVRGMEVVDSIKQKDKIVSVNIVRLGNKAKSFNALEVFDTEMANFDKVILERLKKEEESKKLFQAKMEIDKAVKTNSGLQILTLQKGKGKTITEATKNTIHYTVYLANGTFIQSSKDRNQEFSFVLNEVPMIAGVKEAILTMKQGEKARLFIPYNLAYGERGGGPFPPKSDIVFEIEVNKVE